VAAHDHLSMWWFSRGGTCSPYVDNTRALERPRITPQTRETFQATSDGKYLLAVTGQAIPTWAFPRYAIQDGV
jgi:hypothetical protein